MKGALIRALRFLFKEPETSNGQPRVLQSPQLINDLSRGYQIWLAPRAGQMTQTLFSECPRGESVYERGGDARRLA